MQEAKPYHVIHKPTGRQLTCWLSDNEYEKLCQGANQHVTAYWYSGEYADAINVNLSDLDCIDI